MSFAQKFVPSFFMKDDPLRKEFKRINLYTDNLNEKTFTKGIQIFRSCKKQGKQQQTLKSIIKLMQQKTTYARKLKLLFYLIQVSKQTKYDVADILITKRLKLFTKSSTKTKIPSALDKNSIQQHIYIQLLIPLYNYLMKLSLNEQLYNTCLSKEIPNDEIFRRGMKIRFIWIFKIYNLIHIIIPIIESTLKFIKTFPQFKFFQELANTLFQDMTVMNDFIVKALQQTSDDNYILMPYFDMLQFYESLTEQLKINQTIMNIYISLEQHVPEIEKPRQLKLTSQEISEIQVQALRVKLISNSLKNPKKDHTRLLTQYNVKSEIREQVHKRHLALTEANGQNEQQSEDIQDFKQKYNNLDVNYQKDISMLEVSKQEEQEEQKYGQN